jgi:hypothetical protein
MESDWRGGRDLCFWQLRPGMRPYARRQGHSFIPDHTTVVTLTEMCSHATHSRVGIGKHLSDTVYFLHRMV